MKSIFNHNNLASNDFSPIQAIVSNLAAYSTSAKFPTFTASKPASEALTVANKDFRVPEFNDIEIQIHSLTLRSRRCFEILDDIGALRHRDPGVLVDNSWHDTCH